MGRLLRTAGYDDYQLNENGGIHAYGPSPADYSTSVLAGKADAFIRATKGPLFPYFATWAPHDPPVPAAGYAHAFEGMPVWRPPNYDEAEVSDKPAWVQRLPRFSAKKSASIDGSRLAQYRTLLSASDAIGRIVGALASTGRLGSTMIVFASDNGLAWGEHRWADKENRLRERLRGRRRVEA